MKRLFYISAMALTMSFVTGCAQHDTKSPDTSGAVPHNQPGVGVDTPSTGTNSTATPNMSNDGSNSNDAARTDTTRNQQ